MCSLTVYYGDNLSILRSLEKEQVDLIYIDPPFNTGKIQKRIFTKTKQSDQGDRVGFKGHTYDVTNLFTRQYSDKFDNYLLFIEERLVEAYRILKPTGSLFFHIDYRESHYVKILLDAIFGRDCFMNEIIWAYDYGARSTKRWSPKHDTIFWYVKNKDSYCFNLKECERIPYMAPGLVGEDKSKRGKFPTDVWWHTIVSPTGKEKVGYPTQKPLGILNRIVKVHSNEGDMLMDFFAGSGSFGVAALENKRNCILIDNNPSALEVMEKRFKNINVEWVNWVPSSI